jgi:thioredoxin-like negative regulator of GroEL
MKTPRMSPFAAMAVLGVLLTMVGDARQADPGGLLRAAIEKEDVAGDLEGAMALYRQIIAEHGQNRPVAARALLRLGGCHEKLGQVEAGKAYERLVAEYPDQAQEVARARDRLAAISQAAMASSREPRFREVMMATRPGNTDVRTRLESLQS